MDKKTVTDFLFNELKKINQNTCAYVRRGGVPKPFLSSRDVSDDPTTPIFQKWLNKINNGVVDETLPLKENTSTTFDDLPIDMIYEIVQDMNMSDFNGVNKAFNTIQPKRKEKDNYLLLAQICKMIHVVCEKSKNKKRVDKIINGIKEKTIFCVNITLYNDANIEIAEIHFGRNTDKGMTDKSFIFKNIPDTEEGYDLDIRYETPEDKDNYLKTITDFFLYLDDESKTPFPDLDSIAIEFDPWNSNEDINDISINLMKQLHKLVSEGKLTKAHYYNNVITIDFLNLRSVSPATTSVVTVSPATTYKEKECDVFTYSEMIQHLKKKTGTVKLVELLRAMEKPYNYPKIVSYQHSQGGSEINRILLKYLKKVKGF